MKFRKDGILLAECEIYTFLMTVLCIFLIEPVKWCSLLLVLQLVLMVMYPFLFNEFVLITENGICCCKRKAILWSFSWDEIDELRPSQRFRQNAIEIILSNKAENKYPRHEYYFQMSSKAKISFEKYSKLFAKFQSS